MTPTEHYAALLKRITTWATEEECGKGKIPQTKAQEDLIAERIGFALKRKMFHIEANRHPAQDWFLRARAPTVIAHTGNKWGKTFALLLSGIVSSLGCCPWDPEHTDQYNPLFMHGVDPFTGARFTYEPPIRIGLVVQDFSTSLPEDIILRLKEILPWDAIITRVSRVQGQVIDGFEFYNGSTWRILSHVQEDERFEGWSMHRVLWNEPMPYAKFVGASRGSVEFNAVHHMAFSPLSEPWIVDSLYLPGHPVRCEQDFLDIPVKKPEIVVVEGSIFDNPYNTRESVDRFIGRIQSEEEKEARVWGRWSIFAGRVYKNFNHEVHIKNLEDLI